MSQESRSVPEIAIAAQKLSMRNIQATNPEDGRAMHIKSTMISSAETRTIVSRRRWHAMVVPAALVYVSLSMSLFRGADRLRSLQEKALKPNILLFVLDQWRYDWDGLTEDTPTGKNPLRMPFMKEAAAKGVRFTQAYVPVPLCAPVRACLASGKEYDDAGVLINHGDSWPLDQDTFYKLMRDQSDYQIFSCGKDDLYKNDVNFPFYDNLGTAGAIDLGFTNAMRSAGKHRVTKEDPPFERYRTFLEETVVGNGTSKAIAYDVYKDCFDGFGRGSAGSLCTADKFIAEIYPDDFVADEAIQLLSERKTNKPWFLQVNFPGPHAPEMSTAEMSASVAGRDWPVPVDAPASFLSCPQKIGVNEFEPHFGGRCNYAAELENLDKLMLKVQLYLEDINETNNTVVCMVGDHGEMLGDHSLVGKKVPWQASISVPLVCFGPGIEKGIEHKGPVTTLDLGGTFMDLAGTKANEDMTTQSLRPLLIGGEPTRDFILSGLDDWRLVVQQIEGVSYKLVCCRGECGEPNSSTAASSSVEGWNTLLYDTQADLFDMHPISDKPEIVERLRMRLPAGWCPTAVISADVHR